MEHGISKKLLRPYVGQRPTPGEPYAGQSRPKSIYFSSFFQFLKILVFRQMTTTYQKCNILGYLLNDSTSTHISTSLALTPTAFCFHHFLPITFWQPTSSSAPYDFFRHGESHLLWYTRRKTCIGMHTNIVRFLLYAFAEFVLVFLLFI